MKKKKKKVHQVKKISPKKALKFKNINYLYKKKNSSVKRA
jgi:hypothetical protein